MPVIPCPPLDYNHTNPQNEMPTPTASSTCDRDNNDLSTCDNGPRNSDHHPLYICRNPQRSSRAHQLAVEEAKTYAREFSVMELKV